MFRKAFRLFTLCLSFGAMVAACGEIPSSDFAEDPVTRPTIGKADEGEGIKNDFGFDMRVPQTHIVKCPSEDPNMPEEIEQEDVDWICTFDHENVKGYIYLQFTPVSCVDFGMSTGTKFEAKTAVLSISGKLSQLSLADYDWGGNHHNDSMGFAFDGTTFRYDHSTYGWGYRKCQPMDCMQTYQSQNGGLLVDGCTKERKLPVVCHPVQKDETYEATDFEDHFQRCPGDF